MSKVWYLIPARLGSKTIPKKNIRNLCGKPLILYSLETISKFADKNRVIVSTDDDDVKEIVSDYAIIHNRSKKNADDVSTLDDVALEVASYLKGEHSADDNDILITIQPTSPFIQPETINQAIQKQQESGCDTVLTVTDDRHLRWTKDKNGNAIPLFEKRVNRQLMSPVFSETGGIISTTIGYLLKNGTRIGKKVVIIEVDEREGLDIDTFSDWALAEYWKNKLRIYIRVDGSHILGFGHLYRTIAIAQNINNHDLCFVTQNNNGYELGREFLGKHYYPVLEVDSNEHFIDLLSDLNPDIVINDILDTDAGYVKALKEYGCFVVNFEDLGEGNRFADVVINDLYPDVFPKQNHWYGVEHAILNPNFEMIQPKSEPNGNVGNILIAYGGTDPSDLTVKAMKAIQLIGYEGSVKVVIGPGHSNKIGVEKLANELPSEVMVMQNVRNMAVLMKGAELALTSAGRTVTELMSVGVPTIAMCQNLREMRHNHATSNFGVVNLGLGRSITKDVLADHIKIFLDDIKLRKDMYARMRSAVRNRSNKNVVDKIISEYRKVKKIHG